MIDNFWMNLAAFITLGVANGFISLTVTKSQFFEFFRDFFFHRSFNPNGNKRRFISWIHDLVSCPYCFSHWVALTMVIIWQPKLTECGWRLTWPVFGMNQTPICDYLVSLFALVGVASISVALYLRLQPDE